jgi:hypothetical protein
LPINAKSRLGWRNQRKWNLKSKSGDFKSFSPLEFGPSRRIFIYKKKKNFVRFTAPFFNGQVVKFSPPKKTLSGKTFFPRLVTGPRFDPRGYWWLPTGMMTVFGRIMESRSTKLPTFSSCLVARNGRISHGSLVGGTDSS